MDLSIDFTIDELCNFEQALYPHDPKFPFICGGIIVTTFHGGYEVYIQYILPPCPSSHFSFMHLSSSVKGNLCTNEYSFTILKTTNKPHQETYYSSIFKKQVYPCFF